MSLWDVTISQLERYPDATREAASPPALRRVMEIKIHPPVGQRFGHLIVLGEGEPYPPDARGYQGRRWKCYCDACGKEHHVNMQNVKGGKTTHCGCRTNFRSISRRGR